MHAFSSDSRTPCHVDWNGSSGCAGIVALIAWMTSSKALGRREKETSTDISGETPAGTNRTKQLRRQTCKTAAEKKSGAKPRPYIRKPFIPHSAHSPCHPDVLPFFPECSRSSFRSYRDLLGQRCTWHLHPHHILAFFTTALGLVAPPI